MDQRLNAAGGGAYAIGILKSFVVENGRPKCKIMEWTIEQFNLWKQNGNLMSMEELTGQTLQRKGDAIQILGTEYLERVSEHWQTGKRIALICEDSANEHNWPGQGENFIKSLYISTDMNWEVPPDDRKYPEMLKTIAASWKAGATYLIEKYNVGLRMKNTDRQFMTLSEDLDALPMLVYSGQQDMGEVQAQTKKVTESAETWLAATKLFYHMRPDPNDEDAIRGYKYLAKDEENMGEALRYDEVKKAFEEEKSEFINIYSGIRITMRTVNTIHNRSKLNIETCGQLYRAQPPPAVGGPAIPAPMPIPIPPRERERREDRDERGEMDERKKQTFIRAFDMLGESCQGEGIEAMSDKGEILAVTWEAQELQKKFLKIQDEVQNCEAVLHIRVRGAGVPIDVAYALRSWIRRLKSQEEVAKKKDEANKDKKMQENEDLKAILQKGAMQIKLSGKHNFLAWLSGMESILQKVPAGCLDLRVVNLLKESIVNKADADAIKNMSRTSDIISYIQLKYITDPSLVEQTLMPLERLR